MLGTRYCFDPATPDEIKGQRPTRVEMEGLLVDKTAYYSVHDTSETIRKS
jgi:hypothetical protein